MSEHINFPTPEEQPTAQVEWNFPQTIEELRAEVVRLEALRDIARSDLVGRGVDPDSDPDYGFIQGKLWVFQEHLIASATGEMIKDIEK